MNHKRTILDIEPLLKDKTFEELDAGERAFLTEHLGSESQIKHYQTMLQCCSKAVVITPDLRPNPAIQNRLRNKLKTQSVVKNGLETFFVAIGSLFSVRSPISSGIAVAMLTLTFWFNSNMEQSFYNTFEEKQDSLAIMAMMPDTAVYNTSNGEQASREDSNTMIAMPKTFNHTMSSDSFSIRGILRQ